MAMNTHAYPPISQMYLSRTWAGGVDKIQGFRSTLPGHFRNAGYLAVSAPLDGILSIRTMGVGEGVVGVRLMYVQGDGGVWWHSEQHGGAG